MRIVRPFSQSESSLAMYTIGFATCAGERGCSSPSISSESADPDRRRSSGTLSVIRVAAPGAMQFDVTPYRSSAFAHEYVKPTIPIFAAA